MGSPHTGEGMIWPMSNIVRALTSTDDAEIKQSIHSMLTTHAGTGFIHESFHKDDPKNFTRKWFAWANTIFGELIMETYYRKPSLLNS